MLQTYSNEIIQIRIQLKFLKVFHFGTIFKKFYYLTILQKKKNNNNNKIVKVFTQFFQIILKYAQDFFELKLIFSFLIFPELEPDFAKIY